MVFQDRQEAGKQLAAALGAFAGAPETAVLALPRGGIPVAAVAARVLRLPWDMFVVRKVALPSEPELALGAVASGGVTVLNHELLVRLGVAEAEAQAWAAREHQRVSQMEAELRGGRSARPTVDPRGQTILVVDDGLATGASTRAAIQALRRAGATRLVAAAPVGSAQACREIAAIADQVVCLQSPEPFFAVGEWYGSFPQLTDEEVRGWLASAGMDPGEAA